MKAADIARLSQPFPGGPDVSGRAPAAALGIRIPDWDTLEERIFADLTEERPYGIGWWAPHPGTSRRILISDQLYACTASVSTNLVEAGTHLPLQPERSDVDIHREPNLPPVLTEDSRQTLEGAMESVRNLLAALAERLNAVWEWRKANPAVLPQPQQQWPDVPPPAQSQAQGFGGYAPGSHPYEPEQLTSHPRIGHRMLAAALYDHQRDQWRNFD